MIRWLNLGVAFLLELAVLFAVGYWGFTRTSDALWRFASGLGGPMLMAVIWALFASPKASFPLHGVADGASRIAWFGVGAMAFWLAVAPVAGLAMAMIYVVNALMLGSLTSSPTLEAPH